MKQSQYESNLSKQGLGEAVSISSQVNYNSLFYTTRSTMDVTDAIIKVYKVVNATTNPTQTENQRTFFKRASSVTTHIV